MQELLSKIIKKPFGEFIDEDSLKLVLKKRLTKREFKLFILRAEGKSDSEIKERLSLLDNEIRALWSKIIKKVNKNSIKNEIFIKNISKKA